MHCPFILPVLLLSIYFKDNILTYFSLLIIKMLFSGYVIDPNHQGFFVFFFCQNAVMSVTFAILSSHAYQLILSKKKPTFCIG